MGPDEPEEPEPEEPDNGQGNAAETGTTGHPIMREKRHNGNAVETGTIEKPIMPEKGHNRQAAGLGIIELPGIPEKEGYGQPPRTVPDTTPGSDKIRPDVMETPKEPGKKRGTKRKPPAAHHGNEVYRKTEMPGMSAKSFPPDPAQVRRQTERDLKNPGFGIPYAATEKAVRDLVCSLVEREDRIHADFLLDIDCMQQDIGMLKDQVYALKTMKSGTAAGEKK